MPFSEALAMSDRDIDTWLVLDEKEAQDRRFEALHDE